MTSKLFRSLPMVGALIAVNFVGAACGPLAIEPAVQAENYASVWHDTPDRTWVHESTWANRLQDWRVVDGGLECVEARPRFGMRTLQLLSHRLGHLGREGSFRTRVIVDASDGDRAGSAAGFLVGAGGAHVDPRLTSQVHGTSAQDGGYLAIVDGAGRARFVDFETPVAKSKGGQWVMRTDSGLEDFKPVEGVQLAGPGFAAAGPRPIQLELVGARFDGERTLTLTVRDTATGDVLSTASLVGAPPSAFDGSVALVSHRGPKAPAVDGEKTAGGKGYFFHSWDLGGELVEFTPEVTFGPIMFVHYTVDERGDGGGGGRLRMTAQTGLLGKDDTRTATLEVENAKGKFETAASAEYVEDSATFHFEVDGVSTTQDLGFRVRYVPSDRSGEPINSAGQIYEGVIAAAPPVGEMTIGVLSCQKSYTGGLKWNENGLWFPHKDVRDHVAAHGPHLLYFGGDQIYEGDLTPAVRSPHGAAIGDYLTKWYRHGWSFGELTRRLPTVVVTDDHDVYHGNIWGNAGVTMEATREGMSRQDRGGYMMGTDFVNAVHRTQVAHLPAPYESAPLEGGITTYHTTLEWGGGSFAILNDRMYKSPPAVVIEGGEFKNGWSQNPNFDAAASADVPGATLLGPSQLKMLGEWAGAWEGESWFRACLSQSPFANVATIPMDASSGSVIPGMAVPKPGEYVMGDKRAADGDSNGWPQTGRNLAVAALRDAGAFHLAGDQHLGSTLRYGLDQFDDGGYVLASPAVANTWPRRWYPNPADRQPGGAIEPGVKSPLGRFFDGFGNRMTVLAVANPIKTGVQPIALHDRMPGYGIVRVRRSAEGVNVVFEAWPRFGHPDDPEAFPYGGWPVEFSAPARPR